ncbi:MAG TPA: alpha/beta hydrolase [Vicinamibacterales bacterium]|nr:alpha/beta hydrolase [Vicinamibacterales bacterium]
MPYLHTRDNTRLFYIDTHVGRPIVFVAGAWLNSRMWELQIPHFADRGFRCIAYDRRGHGRSDWPWTGYDYDTLTDDLDALVHHLDLRDVMLVGHSAGAGEVVRYASRYGANRVAAIALVSGTTPFPMRTADNPAGIERALMEADLAVRTRDRAKWFADNADGFFGVGLPGIAVSAEFRQFMIRECLTCSAHATRAFFLTGFTSDLRQDLRRLSVPTMIVHGTHDLQAPLAVCGEPTAALVAGSELHVYQNAAHGLFVTHADRLNTDLHTFARAVVSRSEPARAGL